MQLEIEQLSNMCTCTGLIMKSGQNLFSPIKLALNHYIIKKQQYRRLGQIQKVWQKLIYLASKDHQFIQNTFKNVAQIDQMISNFYQIYLKTINSEYNDFLMFTRVDFFKSIQQQFKIIEYNLTSVSMASHSQNFNRIRRSIDISYKKNTKNLSIQYLQNSPASDIAHGVKQIYHQLQLSGIFLIVIGSKQKNIIDQTYIQLKLLQLGIISKRQTLQSLCNKLQIKNNNKLYLNNELISMVYYRTGYQPMDYCKNGFCDQCWNVREFIQMANVIKIPNIKMELMNQKRMQVQLSKEQVYKKYLNQNQCKILKQSLVFTADFQQNPQDFDILRYIQQKGIDNFILKPNLQGGGNNIYGQQAYSLLKRLSDKQKKNYILMQKINTLPIQNIIFCGNKYENVNCICQISRYGIVAEIGGEILKNSCDGYLVRVKPEKENQGGVMAGVGAICAMAVEE